MSVASTSRKCRALVRVDALSKTMSSNTKNLSQWNLK